MLRLWQYNSLITLYLHSNITCNLKNPNSLPKNDYLHHITVIIVPRMMIIHTIIQILQTVCAHNWKLLEQLFRHDKCNSRGVNHEYNGEKKKNRIKTSPSGMHDIFRFISVSFNYDVSILFYCTSASSCCCNVSTPWCFSLLVIHIKMESNASMFKWNTKYVTHR